MGKEIVSAFKELVDRLKSANVDGRLLQLAMLIEGPTEQTIEQRDLPVVIYELLSGGASEDNYFPDGAKDTFRVMLTVMIDSSEGYFTDERSGMLDWYEKIKDVVDQNTSGTVDLTGNSDGTGRKWGPMPPQYRIGGFERDGMMNMYLIEVDIQTANYRRGTLQS